MKTWFIVLILTTWADGRPQTSYVGPYSSEKECKIYSEKLEKSYEKNYPKGIVDVKQIYCEERKRK